MMLSGLVSVTFRQLSVEDIIAQACQAGLEAIEWGGDVHVPPGDAAHAERTRALTREAGLEVASYGSYYRVGHQAPASFDDVLATAVALGAPVIRVWAGRQGSAEADEAYWQKVMEDSRRIAALAAAEDKLVSYEYHAGSLTDTCAGTLRLLEVVAAPNLRTHWQPVVGRSRQQNAEELTRLLPHLCHLHVFHWPGGQRRPLVEGEADWIAYLKVACRAPAPDRAALLEFVADNDPARLAAEARTLADWLQTTGT